MSAFTRRQAMGLALILPLAACGTHRHDDAPEAPAGSAEVRYLIAKYADHYDVPEDLVHHVVKVESGYNPSARNGIYYGLMQIQPGTARTMGHRGAPQELLNAETNLQYGVKYLRGAWLVARGNKKRAYDWYRRGYYYEAKRMGLLEETGLRS